MKGIRVLLIIALALVNIVCHAQQIDEFGLGDEFADIFNTEVSVASKNSVSINETPGVVSVISYDEIQNMGARDLIDVLNLIPGFDFGMDVTGSIGLGIRGLWAYEGKVLILIDGLEVQEQVYASYQFGNRVGIEQIQRIEIIRGPGSSLYGGNAELGVINIITRNVSNMQGLEVSGNAGLMENSLGRTTGSVNFAKKINFWEFDLKGFYSNAIYSDQIYTDMYGTDYDLEDDGASTQTSNLNLGIKHKGLQFRFMYDDYNQDIVSKYDEVASEPYRQSFSGIYTGLSYEFNLNDKLSITPKLNYKKEKPWQVLEGDDYYDPSVERVLANVLMQYNANERFNLMAGAEYYHDKALFGTGDNVWYNDTQEVKLSNISLFAQGVYKTGVANITAGLRYDAHSMVDAAFSPRISLTKDFNKFHYKVLYSRAFRTPSVANLQAFNQTDNGFEDISPNIKPEKSDVIEVEIGYRFNDNFSLNANVFHSTIHDPMVYFYYYDENTDREKDGYYNSTRYGSKGVELEAKWKADWGYLICNYAYYSAENINEEAYYAVPGNDASLLAFPQHKVNVRGHLKISKNFSLNPSLIVKGKRFGYASLDANEEESVISEYEPLYLLNLYARYKNVFKLPMEIGFGVNDILGQHSNYIQPYDGWHSPFPGPSREFTLKLKYHFNI
ncbi:TonB-dependent siderophore receptor [Carboxylicivirga sp. M1479]|uniref:TonB-dependent receptor plug domain-containing protein n=1 Tax=Carboxylicivirga sp. M1479 TaxID=2594476 RepID=UPI0011785692|nr:TonB-dependent receptor plug domain-containing protein [Carboxylicivirga sp. M1479]TRX71033.1 TonB-dependent receptor [Carboxylicivirga sp. M1479]